MIPFNAEVAVDSVLSLGPYTFTNQAGAIIDLTNCVSVQCDLKFKGEAYATIAAAFVSPKTSGVVWVPTGTFEFPITKIGLWTLQFVAILPGTDKKYEGEEVVLRTKKNVAQLAISEVPGEN